MNNFFFILYAIILGIISFFTGEVVAYVLLGLILMSLNTILSVLKEIRDELKLQRESKNT